ncbi:Gfo/Idh/MocA family protein [Pseudochryseolinea flava]|uniref:Gfo/Idh/MocA family oxidoreductase n=1 Tax=Pseudochryseolinea flava TaxID=2059302 RepID=A0A364Y605_9BACT|nr:Gfo/Idh/MocA family oxidoreductase [Pseudochryseolinea flava]RAW01791.1 gfo/Idh/MocA family oxidoreductase [Pseudochryseolinea flava]
MTNTTRRNFIKHFGQVALTIPGIHMMTASAATRSSASPGADVLERERPATKPVAQQPLGVALVGLGKYSTEQLAPALQETKKCKLKAIVTGSPEKAEKWRQQYNIPQQNIYNYENFDSIKNNPDIDIVYIVLPNSMHAEYSIRAAQAGKHVICEKPMAPTIQECEAMIAASAKANKLLSIGYRLHFEPYNLAMAEFGQNKTFGDVKKIIARDGMDIEPNVWRLNKKLAGGGPLVDVGIYCVQGALYTSGELPVAVTAKEGPKTDLVKFKEVEQSMKWTMEFPSGLIAECETSYAQEMNLLRAEAEEGWFELDPAYEYDGKKGRASDGPFEFPQVREQALQMDDFANCIMNNKKSKVPGEMGLRDVKILTAIYEAARTGKKIRLSESKHYKPQNQ